MQSGELVGGRYELVRRLGRGGMGEVWAARDRTLRREVALKALPAGDDLDHDMRARFEREAVAGAQITHPNVVALHDSGLHDDWLFLVMEKVDGPPLSQIIGREGQLELRRALEVALGVAEALDAAHAAGVVHYDITPRNVMLTAEGRVKVVDFGIAGFVQTTFSLAHSSKLGPAGTPEYVAPERFGPEGGSGERADLYGLGGVLFAMLTGRPPFTGLNLYAVLALKMSEAAPDARSLRPELPPGVAQLVARLLDRDPAARPVSAADVARELRTLLAAVGAGAAVEQRQAPQSSQRDWRGLPPEFDQALQITEGVEVPALRAEVLTGLGTLAFWRDPDGLERYLERNLPGALAGFAGSTERAAELLGGIRRVPDAGRDPKGVLRFVTRFVPEQTRAAHLLVLAREFRDEEAAGKLYLAAGRLLEPATARVATADLIPLATAYARWEPRRAGVWAERVERVLPGAGHGDLLRATQLAVFLDRFDPARAQRLLRRVAEIVGAEGWAQGVRAPVAVPALARIALAGRPMAAEFTAAVLDTAVARALLADKALRNGVLTAYAAELARYGGSPAAIRAAMGLVAGRFDVGRAWGQVLAVARYEDPAELAALIVDAERVLVQRRGRQGPLSGLRGRLEGGFSGERYPTWFVEGVARHDLGRAQEAARQLTEPECLARAHLAMADAAGGTDLATARVHLSSAYKEARLAQDEEAGGAHQVMADLVTSAAVLDPALARRAARHLDAWTLDPGTDGQQVAELALVLVPLDPMLAERFVATAAERARIDTDFSAVLHTLIALAVQYASATNPRTKEMADRIAAASRSILEDRERARVWQQTLPELIARNPKAARVLVNQYEGPDRSALVRAVAPTLARTDLPAAEQLVRTLADAESRDGARRDIVTQLARQAVLPGPHTTRPDLPLPPTPTRRGT